MFDGVFWVVDLRTISIVLGLFFTPTLCLAQGGEFPVMTCYYGSEETRVLISHRGESGYWTEEDRRVEAQMIRSVGEDRIIGMTANRLDGSLSMLSLSRPTDGNPPRRRDAALTVHQETDGRITAETHEAYCDIEELR